MWMAGSESETFLNYYDLHKNLRTKVHSEMINEHDFENVMQYSNGSSTGAI